MKPGSLPSLSQEVEALLSAEREIVPQPELVRRRAHLRARTALWQARSQPRETGGMSVWKRLSLVAAVALVASSGLAAWLTLEPSSSEDNPSGAKNEHPPPTIVKAPDSKNQAARPTGLDPAPAPDSQDTAPAEAAVPNRATTSTAKTGARQERKSAPEEFTLLDKARRGVVGGNYRTALALLDRHAKSFPKSQLAEERQALRVRALKGAGLSKQAGQAASEFESRYPNSVLAPQMNESGRTTP